MREGDASLAEAHEPGRLGVGELVDARVDVATGGGDRPQVLRRVDRGHEQGAAGALGELLDAPAEHVAQARAGGQRRLEGHAARPLVGREGGGQFDEHERVAGRRRRDRRGHRRRQIGGGARQQLAGGRAGKRTEPQGGHLGRAHRGRDRLARRRDERHPLARAPGRVQHALPRGGVQPLQVVDDREHGAVPGGRAQQADRRDAYGEAVARRRGTEREGGGQRIRLRSRQACELLRHRAEEIRQGREGQLGLRLDPARSQDRRVVAALRERLQQRRLADPRLAADHERASVSGPQVVEQLLQPGQLGAAADECLGPGSPHPSCSSRRRFALRSSQAPPSGRRHTGHSCTGRFACMSSR